MTIQQDAKSLKQSESQAIVRNYVLDGAPHTRSTDTGIQKAEVTAKLQGDSLVIETTEPFGGMPGNVGLKIKEVWTLSPDGKTLTIITTRDIPARHQEYKAGLHQDTGQAWRNVFRWMRDAKLSPLAFERASAGSWHERESERDRLLCWRRSSD